MDFENSQHSARTKTILLF